jgi:type IV pilus assembly protein PilO
MEFSLTKIPWYGQVGAFVLLGVGAIVGFYVYYEAPARADIEIREQQLIVLQTEITKAQTTARKLAEFRTQVADLEGKLSNLRAILPEERDAQDLLRRMQTVAAQSSVTIKNFKPEPTITKTLHAEWPISLELDGTYHNLAIFFDRVGKFTRIVNITGLDIKGKERPGANSTISASCTATTFVLLDKQGAKKPGAATPPAAAKGN